MNDTSMAKVQPLLSRLEELEWFEQCLTVTTESPNILTMMVGIRDLIAKRFDFDRVGIMVGSLDPRYCVIHELVTRDDMQACPPGSLMVIKSTGLDWVFHHRTTHYARDIAAQPDFLEDSELASIGIRSIIRVPLTFNQNVFGVMTLKSTEPNKYTQEQVDTVTRLARRLSAGIHALKLIQDLRELSLHDPLTQCYNRYFLNQLMSHAEPLIYLQEATHMEFPPTDLVTAFFLDVSYFKQYNDAHGHLQGDAQLKDLAETLMSTVDDEGVVLRFGGDEFVVLMPGVSAQEAPSMDVKLRRALSLRSNRSHQLTVNIGVSSGTFSNLEELIDTADQYMYQDKSVQKSTS